MSDSNKQNREFKGVWIPKEVWLRADLSLLEKCLWVEVDSLDNEEGCFASNEYFAQFFQTSVPTITRAVKKLETLGCIRRGGFRKRMRVLHSNLRTLPVDSNQFDESSLINLISHPNQNDEQTNTLNNIGEREIDASPLSESFSPESSHNTERPAENLYQFIAKIFLSSNPYGEAKQFYKTQSKALNGLREKAVALAGKHGVGPDKIIETAVEVFRKLRKSDDRIFNSQPFLPNSLNSKGIWPRVWEKAEVLLTKITKAEQPNSICPACGNYLWGSCCLSCGLEKTKWDDVEDVKEHRLMAMERGRISVQSEEDRAELEEYQERKAESYENLHQKIKSMEVRTIA